MKSAAKALFKSKRSLQFSIVHISEDHSAASGGIATVVDHLTRQIVPSCNGMHIVCVRESPMTASPDIDLIEIKPVWYGNAWGWSKDLTYGLNKIAQFPDSLVFHIHGIWMAPQWYGAKIAYEKNIPFLLSAHAMLEPWFWNYQGWKVKFKKKLYWRVMAYPVFKRATIVHAITSLERDRLHSLFPQQRIEVIPNAIDTSAVKANCIALNSNPEPLILFLGRIHPQKGLDIFLRALARANLSPKWRAVIAGPVGLPQYYQEIQKLAHHSGIQNRVDFIGPIYGKEKWKLLNRAWVVVVPSRSEVVGMVNLEASAIGTPTITTFETGLSDWEEGGGLLIRPEIEELTAALKIAGNWSISERLARGQASLCLIEKKYSWEAVLPQWIEIYQSLYSDLPK